MLESPEIEIQNAPSELRPAKWWDLLIYVAGIVGLVVLTTFIAGMYLEEINLWTTVTIGVTNFLTFAGGVFLFGILRRKISWKSLGLFPPKNLLRAALMGTGLAAVLMPIRLLLAAVILILEGMITGDVSSVSVREQIFSVGYDTWYGILLLVLSVGILAPIAEELLFRGLLYDFFRQKTGVAGAVIITSVLFGLAHYDSFAVVISTLIMGVVMAVAVEKTKSLWVSIFLHAATNSGAILLMALLTWIQDFFPTSLQY